MTIYEIDREATGNETEARIQKDGSLGLHFSLISGRKQENGFRSFRRVVYSAKNTKELKTVAAKKAAEKGYFFLFLRPFYDSIRLILTIIFDCEFVKLLRLTSLVEYDIIMVET